MFALVIVSVIAALALGCWVSAEVELRRVLGELRDTRVDLAVALGWDEREARSRVVLHAIEGGEEA